MPGSLYLMMMFFCFLLLLLLLLLLLFVCFYQDETVKLTQTNLVNTVKLPLKAHTLIIAHPPPIWMPQMVILSVSLEFQEALIYAHFENVGKDPIF